MVSGIYKITNLLDNKFYIGSSKNIDKRLSDHFCALKGNYHCNNYLQNSFNKNGIQNFKKEILYTCPQEYLLKLEKFVINKLQPQYNLKQVENLTQFKHSEETILKMSNAAKGRNWSIKDRIKFSEIHKNSERAKQARAAQALKRRYKIDVYRNNIFYKTYESITEAGLELKIRRSSISRALKTGCIFLKEYKFQRNSQNTEKNN